MYDPRRIVFHWRKLRLMIIRHESSDRLHARLREILNPTRYEFVLRAGRPDHKSFGPLRHRWSGF
jgi:hypothetical protein